MSDLKNSKFRSLYIKINLKENSYSPNHFIFNWYVNFVQLINNFGYDCRKLL